MFREFEGIVFHHGDGGGFYDNDPRIITFPFERLERSQLQPGVIITGLHSKTDVEAMLRGIKDAMVADQAPWLGEIEDKTKWQKPAMSYDMFEVMEGVAGDGETTTLLNASATVLRPDRGMVRHDLKKKSFSLQDLIRVGITVEQAIGFRDGESIAVVMRYEYGIYIGSVENAGTRNTTHSIFLSARNPTNSAAKEAIKAARPPAWVRSVSELEEIRWRTEREKEDRREQARRARITRDIRFPSDWYKREKALVRRDKYHIDHPAIGGLPSLGKNK